MLKFIAAIVMLVDHLGMVFFEDYFQLRIVGRLAMPIFAYGIAKGFENTSCFRKYLVRMGLFAMISQGPFWMMSYIAQPKYFSWLHFNIGFTFFAALLTLYLYQKLKDDHAISIKWTNSLLIVGILIITTLLKCDYGAYAILLVLVFYEYYIKRQATVLTFFMLIGATGSLFLMGKESQFLVQLLALPAFFIIIAFKNVSFIKGKYFFYIFYPLHMLILALVKWLQ